MEQMTLPDPRVIEVSREIVTVVAHNADDDLHGMVEVKENGRTELRCKLYPNLECNDHVRTHDALGNYMKLGRFQIPQLIWIEPGGREIFRRTGFRRPEDFLRDVDRALRMVPGARVARARFLERAAAVDRAVEALKAGRHRDAAAGFAEIVKGDIPSLRQEAEAGLEELRRRGDELLERARYELKGRWPDAGKKLLRRIVDEFPDFECARTAEELLKELDSAGLK